MRHLLEALRSLLHSSPRTARKMLESGRRRKSKQTHIRRVHKSNISRLNKANHIISRPSAGLTNSNVTNKRTSVTSSLLLLFAIMESVVSFVLPIVEAFKQPNHVKHTFYLEVFKLTRCGVSIIVLFYLQALLSYYARQSRSNVFELANQPRENNIKSSEIVGIKRDETGFSFMEEASPTRSSAGDQRNIPFIYEQNCESNPGSTSNVLSTSRNCLHILNRSSNENVNHNRNEDVQLQVKRLTAAVVPTKRRVIIFGRIFGDHADLDREANPPYIESEEGGNLYLRLGAVIFGFGVMIMDGFRVADKFDSSNLALTCHSILWIPVNIIHSVYIFYQTYFLFKYHRVIFNIQKVFVRFILCHMTVVNLGQWLSTVVQEVVVSDEKKGTTLALRLLNSSTLANYSSITAVNSSISSKLPQCKSQVAVFAHYLIPCGVEYSLIACAIFYKMFRRVGHIHCNTEDAQDLAELNAQTHKSSFSNELSLRDNPTECHHAHKGLFAGLLLVMSTLVILVLFYGYLHQNHEYEALVLFQTTDIVLFCIGILAVGIALFQMRVLRLKESQQESRFDNGLLLIGLLGILFYDMFLLLPALEASGEDTLTGNLFASKSILEMIQAMMQVFLILEASRSQACNARQVIKKPGRTVITFLLILNLAMWIVSTFGLKHAESYSIHRAHYSDLVWKIIMHLSLPLIIFFRFHSTVCLAEIWSSAYRVHDTNGA